MIVSLTLLSLSLNGTVVAVVVAAAVVVVVVVECFSSCEILVEETDLESHIETWHHHHFG
jgi:hypothetical protein